MRHSLLGDLDPAEDMVGSKTAGEPVTVDNDVNWAARAERDHAGAALDDFAYLFLGEGLGCAIVADGEVRRGHGLAVVARWLTCSRPVLGAGRSLSSRCSASSACGRPGRDGHRRGPAPGRPGRPGAHGRRPRVASSARPSLESSPPSSRSPTRRSSSSADRGAAIPSSLDLHRGDHRTPAPARPRPGRWSSTAEPSLAGVRLEALSRLRSAILAAAHQAQGRPPARTAN